MSLKYGTSDNMTMTYDGNQLKKVTDQCADLTYAGAMDFKDGADKTVEYLWDANGNMTRDRNKNISAIYYNVLNLPEWIEYMDGHIVQYTYAADSRKLRAEYLISNIAVLEQGGINAGINAGIGSPDGVMGGGIIPFQPIDSLNPPGPIGPIVPPGLIITTLLTLDYCGNHVYRNDTLERTINDFGYQADSTYYYYIRDYQGNVRAVVTQNGALKEINNYYPYGGLMGAASAGVQPYKYGGKELDRENGIDWYDFEARYQDPMLPMFTTMDPLAEQAPGISPYAYCAGNPICYIDPHGMNPIYDPYGSFLGQINEGFTGLVYVFWGSSTLDNISDMSIDDAIDTYGLMPMDDFSLTQESTDEDPLLLSNQAKSNIITHIISHHENEKIFEKKFTMKSIENERIDIGDIGPGKNWRTIYHTVSKVPIVIEGSGTFQTDYEGTIENISASILYHEWYGHGVHHLSDENKNHHKAYWCVMQSPLWGATTEKYKEYIKGQYNSYLRKERRGK